MMWISHCQCVPAVAVFSADWYLHEVVLLLRVATPRTCPAGLGAPQERAVTGPTTENRPQATTFSRCFLDALKSEGWWEASLSSEVQHFQWATAEDGSTNSAPLNEVAVQHCGWALDLSAWELNWDEIKSLPTNILQLSVLWIKSSLAGYCNPWFSSIYLPAARIKCTFPMLLPPQLTVVLHLLSWCLKNSVPGDSWKLILVYQHNWAEEARSSSVYMGLAGWRLDPAPTCQMSDGSFVAAFPVIWHKPWVTVALLNLDTVGVVSVPEARYW